MFFVSNLLSFSQAGRRRFESGFPLHIFNYLVVWLEERHSAGMPPSLASRGQLHITGNFTLNFAPNSRLCAWAAGPHRETRLVTHDIKRMPM